MIELSIIICTYNRVDYIPESLGSLVNQDLDDSRYEIIIINNNSPDNTEEVCQQLIKSNSGKNLIKYAVEEKSGLSNARNKGLELAEGKYIAYIDDDGRAEKDYASSIIDAFEQHTDYQALGGKVLPIFPDGESPKWLSKYLNSMVSKVDHGIQFSDFKKKYPVGCNMAFRKELFEELGGFNPDLIIRSDDKYMFYKIKANGKRILYAPSIVVHHHIDDFRLTYEYIRNQSLQVGYGERMRLKGKIFPLVNKFIEYCFKLSSSFILATGFLFKGEKMKAKYLVMVLTTTFKGFILKNPGNK